MSQVFESKLFALAAVFYNVMRGQKFPEAVIMQKSGRIEEHIQSLLDHPNFQPEQFNAFAMHFLHAINDPVDMELVFPEVEDLYTISVLKSAMKGVKYQSIQVPTLELNTLLALTRLVYANR